MAILATDTATQKELIPEGNYVARCYQMLHIGTNKETILGEDKVLNKVRIGWELPAEMRSGKDGDYPCTIGQEFTLSMNEKANLRKMLQSWRGKVFTAEEAKSFDVTKLIGAPCFLNIIHKPSKDGTKIYENIAGVTPMPKGFECPPQINRTQVFQYDAPDMELLAHLPDFIKDKIKSSEEYNKLIVAPTDYNPQSDWQPAENPASSLAASGDDLPF